jgi:hypothetical protein
MSDAKPSEAGLASGVANTSFMMGGALGLAVLAALAAGRTGTLSAAGEETLTALTGGYQLAFLAGGIAALLAAVVGAVFLSRGKMPAHGEPGTPEGEATEPLAAH